MSVLALEHSGKEDDPTRTSIAVFPPELLCCIFRQCVEGKPRDWIGLTHVCRRWREVALSDPELWTNLHIPESRKLHLAFLMLERSSLLPLTVSCDVLAFDDEARIDYMEAVVKHSGIPLHRIKGFSLTGELKLVKLNLSYLLGPDSAVTSLKLVSDDPAYVDFQHFLPGSTSFLRVLNVDSCVFEWNSALFAHLRNLSIRRTALMFHPPSLWLEILSGLPSLEFLSLDDAVGDGPHAQLHLVKLPQLLSFSILGETESIIPMLQNLWLPKLNQIQVHSGRTNRFSPDSGLCATVASLLARLDDDQSQAALPFVSVDISQYYVVLEASSSELPGTGHKPEVFLRFSNKSGLRGEEVLPVLRLLLSRMQVHTLRVACHDHITGSAWVAAFAGLPNLHTFHVCGPPQVCSALDALGASLAASLTPWNQSSGSSDGVLDGGTLLPLPRLTTLVLEETQHTAFAAKVLQMLHVRSRSAGLVEHIRTVRICGAYSLPADTLSELRGLVEYVDLAGSNIYDRLGLESFAFSSIVI